MACEVNFPSSRCEAAMLLLTISSVFLATSSLAKRVIPAFEKCGTNEDGICAQDTMCYGESNRICLPTLAFANSTRPVEVQGYGRPMLAPPSPDDDVIPVWQGCTDANFQGSCLTYSLACNACFPLNGIWVNSLSSIRMLDSRVGCNFWVASNCVGDGINIDSNAIFNLAATNYNDRIAAFNCYVR
ncbi:hypothetical protein AB1N83_011658 [Pleurotus pulmonarius]